MCCINSEFPFMLLKLNFINMYKGDTFINYIHSLIISKRKINLTYTMEEILLCTFGQKDMLSWKRNQWNRIVLMVRVVTQISSVFLNLSSREEKMFLLKHRKIEILAQNTMEEALIQMELFHLKTLLSLYIAPSKFIELCNWKRMHHCKLLLNGICIFSLMTLN